MAISPAIERRLRNNGDAHWRAAAVDIPRVAPSPLGHEDMQSLANPLLAGGTAAELLGARLTANEMIARLKDDRRLSVQTDAALEGRHIRGGGSCRSSSGEVALQLLIRTT